MRKTLLVVSLLILLVACAEPEPTHTPTPTLTLTLVPTPTLTPTPLPTATFIPTPSPTLTPLPTATYTPTATPTITPTPSPTPTPTAIPTPTPVPPTPTPTPVPPTPTPTPVPTWPVSETSGDWIVIDDGVDPLTELRKVKLYLYSTDEERLLQVRCNVDPRRPNRSEVLINWDEEIEEEQPEVTWRLDEERVVSTVWNRSSNGTATFYNRDNVQNFIWRLMNSNKLVARIFADRILTATFELEGLATVLSPYKDSCDWVGF